MNGCIWHEWKICLRFILILICWFICPEFLCVVILILGLISASSLEEIDHVDDTECVVGCIYPSVLVWVSVPYYGGVYLVKSVESECSKFHALSALFVSPPGHLQGLFNVTTVCSNEFQVGKMGQETEIKMEWSPGEKERKGGRWSGWSKLG